MTKITTARPRTYCLMAWAGPHLTPSPMSAPCQCKFDDGHQGNHRCLTEGCRSWRRQRAGDPTWGDTP